jgi:hypothetical protein
LAQLELKSVLAQERYPGWENDIAHYVCQHKSRFSLLMDLFYSADSCFSHRATLIILESARLKPEWVKEQVPKMGMSLSHDLPVWFRRSLLRILQFYRIPEGQWGHIASQCFDYLASADEPVAVKVFSMSVLYNLTRELPDLARELRLIIEDQYPLGSAGFKARARKVLMQLQKDGH